MPPKRKQQYRHIPAFILLVIAEGPIHGGAIHTALTERMPLFKPDTGIIYRTLQQLEQEHEVVSTWDTSKSGPARKIYSLTDTGWKKLEHWHKDIVMRISNLQYFINTYSSLKESLKS
jgi:PadR family transcriptional regulator, regulatory protein PadR